jgi:hypothetical protein
MQQFSMSSGGTFRVPSEGAGVGVWVVTSCALVGGTDVSDIHCVHLPPMVTFIIMGDPGKTGNNIGKVYGRDRW